nr:ribonuclease H-like domain-containing protein [Tanacetum cinerariifolium]
MYVHNSLHNSPINYDHDDNVHDPDPVTRISKLDISDPLHLHLNDTTALTVVSIKLKGTKNYQVLSCVMLLALEGKNKTGFIDRTCKRSNTYDILDDSYMKIRSSILSVEILPDVRSAHATISSEESHRVAAGSIAGFSQRNQASAFISIVPYRKNIQRNNQNNSSGPSRPNNLSNNRQGGGSAVVCENYGFNGYAIDRCFKIIGYPANFGKKKSCQNFKKQNVSKNNSVGISSSSGFTDKQMATLISLIKDNKVGKICRLIWQLKKTNSANIFQDVNHINFSDIEYLDIPNDDERVANDLNKDTSDNNSSSVSGSNINTADFSVDFGNDADSSDELVATQNEKVATIEENIFSEEMDALLRNSTWEMVQLPKGRKAIVSIDYDETFSLVVKMVIVRCLLNIVVSMSWHVFQLDVNNVFLYGDLEEVVYMKPSKGYFPSDNKSKSDYSLTKSDKGVFLALLVYVNDIIITDNSISDIEKFKVYLKSKFMIKDLGKLKYFLGIDVVDTDKCICLNQRKYVLDLLSEYAMLACKPTKTLMSKLVIFNKASDKDPLLENITDYQKLMRKLIYLTNTRPDISYVVHCSSQFMHSSLTSHLKIAFRILRYLKSYPGLGIHITKTSGMFLNAYSDIDWAKFIVTRKSVTGYCVFLNNSFVS